jgi:hypothetical protein
MSLPQIPEPEATVSFRHNMATKLSETQGACAGHAMASKLFDGCFTRLLLIQLRSPERPNL